jgi:hypothetical protein
LTQRLRRVAGDEAGVGDAVERGRGRGASDGAGVRLDADHFGRLARH